MMKYDKPSGSLSEGLKEKYPLTVLKTVRSILKILDGTKKFLFALPDGNL